jgi:hypothetical protein
MGFIFLLVIIAIVGWNVFMQVAARQQLTVSCTGGVAAAQQLVAASFGAAWNRVQGRGDQNFRPRLRRRPPVISVDYRVVGGDGCEVDIWCSHFDTMYGAMNHAQLVWRKKRALASRLAASPAGIEGAPAAGAARPPVSGLDA